MRLSTLFVASIASFAAAASISDLPPCASSCLKSADFGGCRKDDPSCLCQSQTFIDSVTTCIREACKIDDDGEMAHELCQKTGVTLTAPPIASVPPTAMVANFAAASDSLLLGPLSSAVTSAVSSASAAATSAVTSATRTSSANAAPTNDVGHGAMVAGIFAVAALAL